MIQGKFYQFVQDQFLKEYEYNYQKNEHLEIICNKLEEIFQIRGAECNLHIAIPPRYGITQILEYFALWTTHPGAPTIYCDLYSKERADCVVNRIRNADPEAAVAPLGGGNAICAIGAGTIFPRWGGSMIVDAGFPSSRHVEDSREQYVKWINESLLPRRFSVNTPFIVAESGISLRTDIDVEFQHTLTFPAIKEDGTSLWPFIASLEFLATLKQAGPLFNKLYMFQED